MKIDVVLPCLDEEAALGWVLGRMPDGYHPIVVDNGSTDGSVGIATDLGARVVVEPRRGLRRRLPCRAAGGRRRHRLLHGRRRLPRPRPTAAGGRTGPGGRRRSGARPPVARSARRLAGARPARQRRTRPAAAPAHRSRAARPRPDARRPPRRAARPRPARTAGSATRWRWCCAPPSAGWRVTEVDVDYLPRAGRSKVTGTVRGTAPGDPRHAAGHAGDGPMTPDPGHRQGAGARPGQDPALPRPSPPGRPPGWPPPRWRTRCDTVRRDPRTAPGPRPRGTARPLAARRLRRGPAARPGARTSGSRRPSPTPTGGPEALVLIGMDTPQLTPALLQSAATALAARTTRCSARPPTAASGCSACAAPTPRCCSACPCPAPDTGAAQLQRLHRGRAEPGRTCPSYATSTPPPTPARSRRRPRAPGSP